MKASTIVLSVVLIVLGLLLCIANPIGLLFVAIGIGLIVWSVKSPKKAETRRTASRPAQATTTAPKYGRGNNPAGMPSQKPRKQTTCKIAGVTFPCKLDEDENRQDILDHMSVGDPIEVQPYKFRGKPAFLLVDPEVGLDFGTVPADVAEMLAGYPNPSFEGYIYELESFENDDGEYVSFGKVRLFLI